MVTGKCYQVRVHWCNVTNAPYACGVRCRCACWMSQVLVLLSGAGYIAYIRHLRFVPHDFEAELQKMIESGLIKVCRTEHAVLRLSRASSPNIPGPRSPLSVKFVARPMAIAGQQRFYPRRWWRRRGAENPIRAEAITCDTDQETWERGVWRSDARQSLGRWVCALFTGRRRCARAGDGGCVDDTRMHPTCSGHVAAT